MTEDIEFISNVRALATNGTLAEVLRRLEEDVIEQWKIAPQTEERERCWHLLTAIRLVNVKITSLTDEEKVRAWQSQRAVRRI